MTNCEEFQGVSKCYIFKSRLQEYAQKLGIKTPVYETTKEGPSHEPSFRSTVIVNDVRYDSLLGFAHRKEAEQSAAEVALRELSKSSDAAKCISQPVHEIGLCKNLLQEYAQKMNYAVPIYQCQRDISPGRAAVYSCTVEIGEIRYIGAAATTKKEAEIKVARTALLALWLSSTESSMGSVGTSELTVLPYRKRRSESEETSNKPKRKKVPYRRTFKRKPLEEYVVPVLENNESVKPMTAEAIPQDSVSEEIPHANNVYAEHGPSTTSEFTDSKNRSGDVGSVLLPCVNMTTLAKEVNTVSAVKPMAAKAMPHDLVSEDIPHANNVNAEQGSSTAKEVNMVSMTAEAMPQDSVSKDIAHANNVNAEHGSPTAKEVNMVSSVKPMTAEAMVHDSVSEDIPHVNNVTAEHRQSTASDFTNGSSGSWDVGSVSLSCENTTTLAKEVNIVSAVEQMTAENMPEDSLSEHIPHADNANAEHGLSTMTSDFTNATDGSCNVVGSVSLSCVITTTSDKEGNMVSGGPSEASTVMRGPDQ